MHHCSKAVLVICALLLAVGIAWGQGAVGTLNGTVLDSAGAVVPGAAVTAVNVATGVESKTTSTSAGSYTLPYLQAGTFTIRVVAPGFRTATAENVILRAAQTLTVNISLEIGQLSEQVTVSATPPLLESGTAEIGRYISEAEYKTWPILVGDGQRQIQEFIFSSLPGTTGDTFAGSINGGQQYSHEILIEGIPVGRADLSGGNNNEFSPSVESIGEFKLQSGAIGAQYNGGQTAVANFSIKSGTNELHGTGFLYLQNEAFNAMSISNKVRGRKKAKYREDNEGYSIGGPVYIPKVYNGKNKTFFFTNLEKDHYNQLGFSGYTQLPSADFKNGDFSKLFDPAYTLNPNSGKAVTDESGNVLYDALNRPVIFGQLYNPKTTRMVNGAVVRDPFPGNIIPQADWDPVAKNLLALGVPDPTYNKLVRNVDKVSTGNPFFDLHTIGVKIDHNISDRHHFSAFYNHEYRNRLNNSAPSGRGNYMPIPGSVTSSWKDQYTPGRMARASLNSTISPTMINRVSAGFNRFFNRNGGRPETIGKDWAGQLGIQNTSDAFFPTFNFGAASTEVQGGTLAQLGGGGMWPSANGSWVLNDDLTWIKGSHSFHFGYQYTKYYYNEVNPSGSGAFRFSAEQTDLPGFTTDTGYSFASFMLGAVYSASRDVPTLSSGFRQPQHAFYVADDWKITPKLTMNYGLRWEIIPPFFERTGRLSYIDLNAPNPDAGGRPGAMVFGKTPSQTYWKEFGPRLGFAYQVNNKMVVRAGYAMTNTPPIRNDWGYGGFTYGYNGSISVRAGKSPTGFVVDPTMYLSQPFPSYNGTLPDTNPSSGNYNASQTTAPDANRPGYVSNYNFTVQYQLPQQTVLEVAYVGNKGTRLWGGSYQFGELNGLPASKLAMGDILYEPVSSHPEFTPFASFPGDSSVSTAMRPYPQFYGIEEAFPYNTNSNYNSLQFTVTRHLTTGLGFLAGYTWSKTLGYNDAQGAGNYYGGVQDYYNRKLERAIAIFNYPRNFKMTWVYETPFGKGRHWDLGKANFVLGGWELSAIHNYHSGGPLSVYSSGLTIPDGFSGSIRPDVVAGVPMTLGSAPTSVDLFTGAPYVNPAAFQNVPTSPINSIPLRVGTAPRIIDGLRGPHYMSEQFRMAKKFPIKERAHVGVGLTMINPFNRIGRGMGSMTIGDSDFGTVYANGGGQRKIQMEARVEF